MAISPPTSRERILRAAEELIHDRGLAGATTRAIAARAGCAEGSIYRHFPDKQALFHEIVKEGFPEFLFLLGELPDRAGKLTVRRNLETVALSAIHFYRGMLPLIAGMMADPDLVLAQRRHWLEAKAGPQRAFGALSSYLRREQALGRVSSKVSAEHVARLVLGVCFAETYVVGLLGEDVSLGDDEGFVKESIGALMRGIDPAPAQRPRRVLQKDGATTG